MNKTIVVATYGRSGSTLLIGILNKIEGHVIRGENEMFTLGLWDAYKRLKDTVERQASRLRGNDQSADPWFGASTINLQSFLTDCEICVRNVLMGERTERVYGFKEIRFHHLKNDQEFFSYMGFMRKVMPGLRVVFLRRDAEQVLTSKWRAAQGPDYVRKIVATMDDRAKRYCGAYPDHALSVSYDDLQEPERLRPLFEFLGEKFDAPLIAGVLAVRHSY